MRAGARIGNHLLIRELGRGGMGAVYLARDLALDRKVAIKFLLEPSPGLRKRFLVEARATARCRHEHIVDIFEVGESDGHAYMVLEYIEGQTLLQAMQARTDAAPGDGASRWTPEQTMDVMVPVLRALAHAHQMGIVHRDLKPGNIMISDNGRVKVLDFGIAKILMPRPQTGIAADDVDTAGRFPAGADKTKTGAIMGTFHYMSPEQLNGMPADHRSDLWAVGIMLFEMLDGHHPLGTLSLPRLMAAADVNQPMPRLSASRPELGALAEVVDQCLRKRTADRMPDARTLLQALGDAMPRDWTSPGSPESSSREESPPRTSELDAEDTDPEAVEAADAEPPDDDPEPPAAREPTADPEKNPRPWPMVVGGAALLAALVAGTLLITSRTANHEPDPSAVPTEATSPSTAIARSPVTTESASQPPAEAVIAIVDTSSSISASTPARALHQRLQDHPHAAGLLPTTQDARPLIWYRAAPDATMTRALEFSRDTAIPVVLTVEGDGRGNLAVRGPQGTFLVEEVPLFAATEPARDRLVPVLYSLAQIQRGQPDRAGCVALAPETSVDALTVLSLYVDRALPTCRDHASTIAPAALLSVCTQGDHQGICQLARRMYTDLFPDAPDVLSVLRELIDEQPAYAALDGAALTRASCRLDRLPTALAVLTEVTDRLGTAPAYACDRLAFIDAAACIATHPRANEELGPPDSWRAVIDALERGVADDCSACGNPAFCGQKLGQRGMVRSRRGRWERAAQDFEQAYARSHDSAWALMHAEASLHLGQRDQARRRLRQLSADRILQTPIEHLQHALFSWLAEGKHRAAHAQRLVDVYQVCCTDNACTLDPDDAPLRALTCDSDAACVYDLLSGPRTRDSVVALRRALGIDATEVPAISDDERAALLRSCSASDR